MGALVPIGFFALGLFQIAATFGGVQHFLGVHWVVAGAISLVLGAFPVVGTAAGVYGASVAWGWGIWEAAALFFGPMVALFAIAAIAGAVQRRA